MTPHLESIKLANSHSCSSEVVGFDLCGHWPLSSLPSCLIYKLRNAPGDFQRSPSPAPSIVLVCSWLQEDHSAIVRLSREDCPQGRQWPLCTGAANSVQSRGTNELRGALLAAWRAADDNACYYQGRWSFDLVAPMQTMVLSVLWLRVAPRSSDRWSCHRFVGFGITRVFCGPHDWFLMRYSSFMLGFSSLPVINCGWGKAGSTDGCSRLLYLEPPMPLWGLEMLLLTTINMLFYFSFPLDSEVAEHCERGWVASAMEQPPRLVLQCSARVNTKRLCQNCRSFTSFIFFPCRAIHQGPLPMPPTPLFS